MRKLSPRALAIAAGHYRATTTLGLAIAVFAAASLWVSGVGSAATSSSQIAVSKPATKTLPKKEQSSPPGNPIKFPQNAMLTCGSGPNGQLGTCTAIATLVGDAGPLNNIPLANYARVFTSADSPIQLVFGLSQNTLNLLYKHRGDPRCTVTVTIVNDSSAAGTPATGAQASSAAAGTGSQSLAPTRTFFAYINVL